jgi:hypothetical protein
MSTLQKAQSPVGAGQSADKTADVAIVAQPRSDRKTEATLIALFALAGHSVHRQADGGYMVCRFGYSKHCLALSDMERFARQTGVLR